MNKYKTTIDFFKTKYGIGKNTIYEIYNKFGLNKRINNLVFPFEKFRRISRNIKSKPIEKELINIQKNNITFLSYYMIPQMIKRDKKSGIINLSSISAESPLPYF
jgi:ribosomal protein S13